MLIAAATAAPNASDCNAAPASATSCIAFDGGIAFTEVWEDSWFGGEQLEDLTVVCGSSCRVTVNREDDSYVIYDESGVRELPSAARQLAVVSVFGSSGADTVDITGLTGQTFAHLGGGDDTLFANSCTAITASRGDVVRCAQGVEQLSAR